MRQYRGRILHSIGPDSVEDIRDGLLVVEDDGRISYCGAVDSVSAQNVEDLRGRLIIPGLIDVHSHIPQLDERGKHGATLLDWLQKYIFPAELAFADPKIARDVSRRFFKKQILNGITCSGLYSTVHEEATDICFQTAAAAGTRCFIGKVMMDVNSPKGLAEKTLESLAASERLCAKWHGAAGGRLAYAFTPRFVPTCSMELWRGVGRLARQSGAYIQSHIAETLEENAKVREMHPNYRDYVEFMEDADVLGAKTILAHAIYLSDDEMRRLGKSGTKVAHCHTSNFFLKSGRMSVSRIEAAGIDYSLATDVGAGTAMSLFIEMRHADYTQPDSSISPQKAFYLATLAGAKVMSMEADVGNFQPGKYADFSILDINGIDRNYSLAGMDTDELLSLLMYRGDGRAIERVYVAGSRLDVDSF